MDSGLWALGVNWRHLNPVYRMGYEEKVEKNRERITALITATYHTRWTWTTKILTNAKNEKLANYSKWIYTKLNKNNVIICKNFYILQFNIIKEISEGLRLKNVFLQKQCRNETIWDNSKKVHWKYLKKIWILKTKTQDKFQNVRVEVHQANWTLW